MLKAKINSLILATAQIAVDKLRSIDSKLDLGNGLTLESFSQQVEETRTTIANYNTAAAELEKMSQTMKLQEMNLRNLLKRMIMGVGAKFGDKSSEYKLVRSLWKLTRRSANTPPTQSPIAPPINALKTSPEPIEPVA